MAEINGDCEERLAGVAKALTRNLDHGLVVGASVAVVLNREFVRARLA